MKYVHETRIALVVRKIFWSVQKNVEKEIRVDMLAAVLLTIM